MKTTQQILHEKIVTPPLIARKDPYLIKFAETGSEVLAAQKLRYAVFNQEQGKGLSASRVDGVDRDEYDKRSIHLLVKYRDLEEPVGTYRIILGAETAGPAALYSAREFDFSGLARILPKTLEVGRSCVSHEHRDGSVVALLWAGISIIMERSAMRFLAGCVSLEDTRPETAWALFDFFCKNGCLSESVRSAPRPEFRLARPPDARIAPILADRDALFDGMPPLLKGYLRMGAKICGPPAFDYEFGTSDFFILLDVASLPDRYRRHFKVKTGAADL